MIVIYMKIFFQTIGMQRKECPMIQGGGKNLWGAINTR
jgi:hypothetical protein